MRAPEPWSALNICKAEQGYHRYIDDALRVSSSEEKLSASCTPRIAHLCEGLELSRVLHLGAIHLCNVKYCKRP